MKKYLDSIRRRVAQDAARGFDAPDRAGEGHGQQDKTPIDCCVGGRFSLISDKDEKICTTPHIGRIEPIQADAASPKMRRLRAGGGGTWLA